MNGDIPINPKTTLVIIGVLAIFITSCAPTDSPAQMTKPPTEPATQETFMIEAHVATEPPTEHPLACVTLLTPENGANLPPTGKAIFS